MTLYGDTVLGIMCYTNVVPTVKCFSFKFNGYTTTQYFE